MDSEMNEEVKYCNQCGAKISPGAKFCSNCGHDLINSSTIKTTLDKTIKVEVTNATVEKGFKAVGKGFKAVGKGFKAVEKGVKATGKGLLFFLPSGKGIIDNQIKKGEKEAILKDLKSIGYPKEKPLSPMKFIAVVASIIALSILIALILSKV